ncbi:MAG: hypothetical protein K2W92_08975 [Alphaproteobacteria bacterium]|nr:hypothetical protein [Alphaproteobacteria bacterium]
MRNFFLKNNFLALLGGFFFLGIPSVKAMEQTENAERKSHCKRSLDFDEVACQIPSVVRIVESISQLAFCQTKSRNGQARKLLRDPEFIENLATAFYVDALLCALEHEELEMTASALKQILDLEGIQEEILQRVQTPLTLTTPVNNEEARDHLALFIEANGKASQLVIDKDLSWPPNLLDKFIENSLCFHALKERLSR